MAEIHRTLDSILESLTDDGTPITLSFPSDSEMERFRQIIYKHKKNFDDVLFALSQDYKPQSLKFLKKITPDGCFVELSLGPRIRAPIEFSIVLPENSPFSSSKS